MGKYYEHKSNKSKSGYLICVVPTCQTKKSTTTLKTFEFPSDLKRRSQWISAIVEATIKNEENALLEDLYAVENRRIELEMEIANILGDHSYVCARHFQLEDIIVHPSVCRLTPNAVPSVFNNYPTELPRQFFKKICQAAQSTSPEFRIMDVDSKLQRTKVFDDSTDRYLQEVTIYESYNEESFKPVAYETDPSHSSIINDVCVESRRSYLVVNKGTNTRLKCTGISNGKLQHNKLRKKLRLLQLRYKNIRDRLSEIEAKHKLYNISSLEKDAENKNEEAIFLLEMLRSYTLFENTRNEILASRKNS